MAPTQRTGQVPQKKPNQVPRGAAIDDAEIETGCWGNFTKHEQAPGKAASNLKNRIGSGVPNSDDPNDPCNFVEKPQLGPDGKPQLDENGKPIMVRTQKIKKVKKKYKGGCIEISQKWWFKLLPWSIVSSTPIVGLMCIQNLLNYIGFKEWGFFYTLHIIIGVWLSIQVVYNFIMASTISPGFVNDMYIEPREEDGGKYPLCLPAPPSKKQLPEMDEAYEQGTKKDGVEMSEMPSKDGDTKSPTHNKARQSFRKKDEKDEYSLNLYYAPRLCAHCNVWKPPRSHHDSVTGKCVLRMDHFCPFTGNVIAARNHAHFFLMYCFAHLGLFFAAYLCLWNLWFAIRKPEVNFFSGLTMAELVYHAFQEAGFSGILAVLSHPVLRLIMELGLGTVILIILIVIFLIIVSSCGGPAMYFVLTNVTAIEYNVPNLNEYVEIAPQVFCPIGPTFYTQLTWSENVKQLLGEKWWWRILLPVRGNVDWKMLGYYPPCSPHAVSQLHMRMRQYEDEGSRLPERSYEDLGITAPSTIDPGSQYGHNQLEKKSSPAGV